MEETRDTSVDGVASPILTQLSKDILSSGKILRGLRLNTICGGLSDLAKNDELEEFCIGIMHAVKAKEDHFQSINNWFSGLVPSVKATLATSSCAVALDADNLPIVQDRATAILQRLPGVPQRLFSLPLHNTRSSAREGTLWDSIKDGRWVSKYLMGDTHSKIPTYGEGAEGALANLQAMQDLAWDNLFVTRFIDTNNVVIAWKIADKIHEADFVLAHAIADYVDVLSSLVTLYDDLVQTISLGYPPGLNEAGEESTAYVDQLLQQVQDTDEHELQIGKIFLWSAWQRSVMLYFYYVVGVQIWHGSSPEWSALLSIQGLRQLHELQTEDPSWNKSSYLCNWALELLRTGRTSLGLDFRGLISRFDDHFTDRVIIWPSLTSGVMVMGGDQKME
ncbi:MAG: hypothetical protein LQ351_007148 [Letrouitia transgressa]|nr:MAG: hypothetical protein LQ351_007148 [Letrouitia transgressa]